MTNTVKDKRGVPVDVGDTVAVAVLGGYSTKRADLRIGTVEGFTEERVRVRWADNESSGRMAGKLSAVRVSQMVVIHDRLS